MLSISLAIDVVKDVHRLNPRRMFNALIPRSIRLAEAQGEAIKYRIVTAYDGGPTGRVALAGPTCDSTDVIYECTHYELPLALTAGDRIRLLSTGAYTTTYASVAFNGFAPLRGHYLPVEA